MAVYGGEQCREFFPVCLCPGIGPDVPLVWSELEYTLLGEMPYATIVRIILTVFIAIVLSASLANCISMGKK